MSFWNFLGTIALFNAFRNKFSRKPKNAPLLSHADHESTKYPTYHTDYHDDYDIDALEERINKLEKQLEECDVLTERYDEIQDEIDELQDLIDEREFQDDLYELDQDDDFELHHNYNVIAFDQDLFDD